MNLTVVVVDRDHVLDVGDHPRVQGVLGVPGPLVGEHHVFGREAVPVVEGHSLAELEGPLGAVIRDRPALREVALRHELAVDVHQSADDVGGDLELEGLVDLGGVDGLDLRHPGPAAAQACRRSRRAPGAYTGSGEEVVQGQRARGRHQAQSAAPAHAGAAQRFLAEAEERVPGVEVVCVLPLVLDALRDLRLLDECL